MSAFQIHSRLSASIQLAAELKTELADGRLTLVGRMVTWFRLVQTDYQIRCLKADLR